MFQENIQAERRKNIISNDNSQVISVDMIPTDMDVVLLHILQYKSLKEIQQSKQHELGID